MTYAEPLRGLTDTASLVRTHTHDTGVHGTRDAVVVLHVQLGEGVHLVGTGGLKIVEGTSVDHVTDDVSLDSLILQQEQGR